MTTSRAQQLQRLTAEIDLLPDGQRQEVEAHVDRLLRLLCEHLEQARRGRARAHHTPEHARVRVPTGSSAR